jgi:hypothetical protein
MKHLPIVMLLAVSGCAPPPAAAPVSTPAESVAPVAKSEAALRADALLADMQKREADYKKDEAALSASDRRRQLPINEPVVSRSTERQPPLPTSAPTAEIPSTMQTISFGGHEESWWKNEMRKLQVQLDDDLRKFNGAMSAWKGAIDSMNTKSMAIATTAMDGAQRAERDAQQLKAVVQSDRDAIERLREDARRANVPPGWLRWP